MGSSKSKNADVVAPTKQRDSEAGKSFRAGLGMEAI
jgi:hypothetical protein